ncbi:MAG: hypothetical protein ACRDK9_03390, partial [Solirubrobacterales bacterium]
MNEDQGAGAGPSEEIPQGSVFGNLPGSRPGVRSPRRDRARRAGGVEPERSEPEPLAAAQP